MKTSGTDVFSNGYKEMVMADKVFSNDSREMIMEHYHRVSITDAAHVHNGAVESTSSFFS